MNLQIVNAELGIASCTTDVLPEWRIEEFKQQVGLENIDTLTFFYMSKRDWIVLNRECKFYDMYLGLIECYLELTEEQRAEFKAGIDHDSIKRGLDILDTVVKRREGNYSDINLGRCQGRMQG